MVSIFIVFALIIVAVVLFVLEYFSFDVVALIITSTLLVSGILTVEEGLSGFSNQATITIAAMFVLSEGIRRTGALNTVGDYLSKLGKQSYWLALIVIMVVIGVCSAFINNTAAVAIFIPVIVGIAAEMKVSPSKLLMPISFAAMLGGACTLIGTSTNLLVSSIAQDYGESAFSMFELTPLGIIFLFVGLAYLFTVGIRMIPPRRTERDLAAGFELNDFLTDVVINPNSEQIGKRVDESSLVKDLDLDVMQVFREDSESPESQNSVLKAGDVLRIRGNAREIEKLVEREDVSLKPRDWYDADLANESSVLVEAVVAPESSLESQKINQVNFKERFGVGVLAIRRGGKLMQERFGEIRLSGGDSLLLSVYKDHLEELKRNRGFVLVSEVGLTLYRQKKMPIAIAILAGVVGLAAFKVVPIAASAVAGCVILVLTGCLTNQEAYDAINWEVILLLGGVLPLGIAMEKTGAARILSNFLISGLGSWGHTTLLSGFFFSSMLMTNIISNQATAALLAPIAIQAAGTLDVSPRPFLLAVTYAASLSFLTPVGYQTNTMIYGPGEYKFTDFTKIGAPLNLALWLIATFMIPIIWEF